PASGTICSTVTTHPSPLSANVRTMPSPSSASPSPGSSDMSRTTSRRPRSNSAILPSTVASVLPRASVNPMAQLPPGRKPTSAPSHHHDNRSDTRVNASNASVARARIETERTIGSLIQQFYSPELVRLRHRGFPRRQSARREQILRFAQDDKGKG